MKSPLILWGTLIILSLQDSLAVKYITHAEVRLVRSDGFEYHFELSDDSTFYYSDDLAQQGHYYSLEVRAGDRVFTSNTVILHIVI